MAEPDAPLAQVFVVSDGTGDTCAAAARAAMLQFQDPWRIRMFGGVRHPSEARRVIAIASVGVPILLDLLQPPHTDPPSVLEVRAGAG